MKSFRTAALVAACSAGLTAFAFAAEDAKTPGSPTQHGAADHAAVKAGEPTAAKGDIIDVATGAGMSNVTTLVAAIKAADLVDTLKGPGPFTVFAPTNAAFDKLGKEKVAELLKPENKDKLRAVLLGHVHSGAAIKAADVKTMELSTADGKDVHVKVADGKVTVNNATVIKTDVMASNGIIHQVDSVILPEAHNH